MAKERVYARVSPSQFLLLNPQFSLQGSMFIFQTVGPSFLEPTKFDDVHHICCQHSTKSPVKKFGNDNQFGSMYIIIGEFCSSFEEIYSNAYLVVVHSTVDLDNDNALIDDTLQNDSINPSRSVNDMLDEIHRVHSLHLVIFSGKETKAKISRRTKTFSQGPLKEATSSIYKMMLYADPLFFFLDGPPKVPLNTIHLRWICEFQNDEDVTKGLDLYQSKKRRHVILVQDSVKDNLIRSADLLPDLESRQLKSLKVMRKEVSDITYSKLDESMKSNSNKMNLREEAISLLDEAFRHHCEVEDFILGFNAMKDQCLTDDQTASTVASVLMDSFYRIGDCPSVDEKVITKVGIDVDQVVLKCELKFSNIGKSDREKSKIHVDDQQRAIDESLILKKFQYDFLSDMYNIVRDSLDGSKNMTTSYTKSQINQSNIKKGGSSLETSQQRSRYFNICTTNLTSEVLNISFRHKGSKKACTDEVSKASDIVVQFLLSNTEYENHYSLLHFYAAKSAWDKNATLGDIVHVPGGLLFPILTILLISYLADDPITIVVESYGGKRRGIHVHYDFEESFDTSIPKAINNLKEADQKKIVYSVLDAFDKIEKESELVSKVTVHIGVGCDAIGCQLANGDTSFLVCSPVSIDLVDDIRKGPTRNVFCRPEVCSGENVSVLSKERTDLSSGRKPQKQRSVDLSALTREAAMRITDADSDSDLDEEPVIIRHRYFAPSQMKHHVRYPLFSGLGSWVLSPFTHTMPKVNRKLLGHEVLDQNTNLHRIQSYSPNIRVLHGKNGILKTNENLFDIRKFAAGTDEKNHSIVCISDAESKVKEWLNYAKKNVKGLRENCGMARLELTFKTTNINDSTLIAEGVTTLMRTFKQNMKVYSGSVVSTLAEISLLSFEGISKALFHWFSPRIKSSEPPSWNIFSEVWNFLTHFATHFFDGRRSFLTNRLFCPRLSHIFSRLFINPSWAGINESLRALCSDNNLEKLTDIWYIKSKLYGSYFQSIEKRLTSSILEMDTKFENKISTLLQLISANTRHNRPRDVDAIACSHCQMICSVPESKNSTWPLHPCDSNDLMGISSSSLKRNVDLRSEEFDLYIKKISTFLSASQAESLATIMNTTQNCFLTGGAGSGKSFLLKVFYPLFIKLYGFCGVALTGPTNIAAANIFGITLHKFLGLTVGGINETLLRNWNAHNRKEFLKQYLVYLNNMKPSVTQNASSCQVLIIDEAGMIDWFTFNLLDEFLRMVRGSSLPFGGVRIILIGDVLQLEPVVKNSSKGYEKANLVFYQHKLFESFFVAYLRTNLRQKNDSEFIDALNQVRIGDGSAADYLNDSIFSRNSTSKSTLMLARKKKDHFNQNDDIKMPTRINQCGLNASRIKPSRSFNPSLENDALHLVAYTKEIENIDNRILSARVNDSLEIIVCHDNIENRIYTALKNKDKDSIQCKAKDVIPNVNKRDLNFIAVQKQVESKLLEEIFVYKGMCCRVTYPTDNAFICTNALVVITDITICPQSKLVTNITIKSTDKNISVLIVPVTITEKFSVAIYGRQLEHEYSRTQFGLIDSSGLVPWNLQCLTLSCPVFYDNSRSSSSERYSTKGLLYTIISRVKNKEQLSFLHKLTSLEIINGVSTRAKAFDNQYRLRDGVVFNVLM